MKKLEQQQQQGWQQPQPQITIAAEEETETEDLAQEDSEGDGLMLIDDPMFPADSENEDGNFLLTRKQSLNRPRQRTASGYLSSASEMHALIHSVTFLSASAGYE